jgi:hypothetical protein
MQMPFFISSELPCLENIYINYDKVEIILLSMIINQESRCNDDSSGNRPVKLELVSSISETVSSSPSGVDVATCCIYTHRTCCHCRKSSK